MNRETPQRRVRDGGRPYRVEFVALRPPIPRAYSPPESAFAVHSSFADSYRAVQRARDLAGTWSLGCRIYVARVMDRRSRKELFRIRYRAGGWLSVSGPASARGGASDGALP